MKFKVGDIVVIKDNISIHGFEIGEKVEIITTTGFNYKAKPLNGNGDCWWVIDDEIKKPTAPINLNNVEHILHFTIQILEHNNKTLQSFKKYEQFEKFIIENKSGIIGFNKNKSGFIETLRFVWSLK